MQIKMCDLFLIGNIQLDVMGSSDIRKKERITGKCFNSV